jgi:hypothetical protein
VTSKLVWRYRGRLTIAYAWDHDDFWDDAGRSGRPVYVVRGTTAPNASDGARAAVQALSRGVAETLRPR